MQERQTSLLCGPLGFVWIFVSLSALAILAGCGAGDKKATAKVHGKVTYKGKPLAAASLLFVPVASGTSAQGTADRDGNYVLGTYGPRDGAIVGEHKVMITAMNAGTGLPEDTVKGNAGLVSVIPSRYTSLDQSGLKATVKSGVDNEINFELTD